ncbi:4a-hydroxytetrahydrobiopterin dehydratase [Kytococcus sedentarius]|uniref:4a-hydroxytetrahydrobiopterin dehydratase n=1 Tax=Kytococcus sedentarius TaxID=1276 RepID=UPI0035BBFABA
MDSAQTRRAPAEWRELDGRLLTSFAPADHPTGAAFVAGIAELAQELDHHPEVTLALGRVTVTTHSHDVGAVTRRDHRLARRIDALAAEHGVDGDPERFHSATVWAPASPDEVYALVSDVTRTGQWSPTCRTCRWTDPAQTGVGATFEGDNETPTRQWTTTSTVVAAEPGRRFAWQVGEGYVEWGFSLAPGAEDGTLLTQTWHFTRAGRRFFDDRWGEHATEQAAERERRAHADMPVTLARIVEALH